jgi:acetylornithine deacetylase/succinyl-diaminopimelate desuccinylase-like protein
MFRLVPLLLAITACAAPRTLAPSLPQLEAVGNRVDWGRAGDEAAQVLSAYLQVDTINPPGNEARGAEFFRQALAREGIESEQFELAPGRTSLVARLKATGTPTDKPVCLLSHLDVVPAEADQWPKETQPLSGAIDAQGVIWGRGALDMKGMGAIELLTLVWLKRLEVPLQRDVILLAVADEELDNRGMRQLVDSQWGAIDCGVLVNEGGMGLKDLLRPGQTVYPITVAEKGTLWLKVRAHGEAGHGSTPVDTRAPTTLLRALARLATRVAVPSIHPALYELLRRAGEQAGGVSGFVLQHPALVDAFVTQRLLAVPPTRASITNTCQVTGFEGKGSAPNVVPSETSAILDCRLLPGTQPDTLLAELKALVSDVDGVTLEVTHAIAANESTWEDPFFDALVRQLTKGRPDVVAGPAISPGFTDSILARPKGTKCYGLVPFEVDGELLGTMHGRNERVSKANVQRGLEVLFRAVVDVAARP